MGLIDEVVNFVINGNIGGLPPLAVMILPFVVGLIVGFLVNKVLKIAVIVIIVLAVAIYFGLYSLDVPTLQQLAQQYGPAAVQLGVLIVGVLPLGIGFIVGAIIGFILG
jgi:uncharacterized membrane protein (Fun14 family)